VVDEMYNLQRNLPSHSALLPFISKIAWSSVLFDYLVVVAKNIEKNDCLDTTINLFRNYPYKLLFLNDLSVGFQNLFFWHTKDGVWGCKSITFGLRNLCFYNRKLCFWMLNTYFSLNKRLFFSRIKMLNVRKRKSVQNVKMRKKVTNRNFFILLCLLIKVRNIVFGLRDISHCGCTNSTYNAKLF